MLSKSLDRFQKKKKKTSSDLQFSTQI